MALPLGTSAESKLWYATLASADVPPNFVSQQLLVTRIYAQRRYLQLLAVVHPLTLRVDSRPSYPRISAGVVDSPAFESQRTLGASSKASPHRRHLDHAPIHAAPKTKGR